MKHGLINFNKLRAMTGKFDRKKIQAEVEEKKNSRTHKTKGC